MQLNLLLQIVILHDNPLIIKGYHEVLLFVKILVVIKQQLSTIFSQISSNYQNRLILNEISIKLERSQNSSHFTGSPFRSSQITHDRQVMNRLLSNLGYD